MLCVYLLVIPAGKDNQLEILPLSGYYWQVSRRQELLIVGMACKKQEAVELVQSIVSDVYRRTGTADIRAYFMS